MPPAAPKVGEQLVDAFTPAAQLFQSDQPAHPLPAEFPPSDAPLPPIPPMLDHPLFPPAPGYHPHGCPPPPAPTADHAPPPPPPPQTQYEEQSGLPPPPPPPPPPPQAIVPLLVAMVETDTSSHFYPAHHALGDQFQVHPYPPSPHFPRMLPLFTRVSVLHDGKLPVASNAAEAADAEPTVTHALTVTLALNGLTWSQPAAIAAVLRL